MRSNDAEETLLAGKLTNLLEVRMGTKSKTRLYLYFYKILLKNIIKKIISKYAHIHTKFVFDKSCGARNSETDFTLKNKLKNVVADDKEQK